MSITRARKRRWQQVAAAAAIANVVDPGLAAGPRSVAR